MQIFLVGGAVRDELLGLAVTEKDYVVVGSTPEDMQAEGYRSVGRDFPVFLHPRSHEEYALARTERKTGPGHTGFVCHASPDVTLEEDLFRRDLTINAIARVTHGQLIDPTGGQRDLKARHLRHVSDAFSEDPLRILRLARFLARFYGLGFEVHPSTRELVKNMVANNLLAELAAERILAEFDKALATDHPAEFFRFLEQVGAADFLWPEINHNNISFEGELPPDLDQRFALLFHTHEDAEVVAFCERLKCSRVRTDVARLVAGKHKIWATLMTGDSSSLFELLKETDAFRNPDRFQRFNNSCESVFTMVDSTPPLLAEKWSILLAAALSVKAHDVITTNGEVAGDRAGDRAGDGAVEVVGKNAGAGPALGLAILEERRTRVNNALQQLRGQVQAK